MFFDLNQIQLIFNHWNLQNQSFHKKLIPLFFLNEIRHIFQQPKQQPNIFHKNGLQNI